MGYISNLSNTPLFSSINTTSVQYALPAPSMPHALAATWDVKAVKSPVTVGLTTIAVALVSLLISALWRPRVHKQSPAFTSDTIPFFGSFGFIVRGWSFWQSAVLESKTGHFSFWLGKRHVVGISGIEARKLFYDHPNFELVSGSILNPFGPHFFPPVHSVFLPNPQGGRSFFLRRIIAMLKTEQLEKYLPGLLKDTRTDFAALMTDNPNGVITTPGIWKSVVKHNTRLFFTDEVIDDPQQWQRYVDLMDTALHTASIFNVAFPWLPAPNYIKRRLMRRGLQKITAEYIDKRMAPQAPRKDDPLQFHLDNSDRKEFMVEYFFSVVFVSSANTHAVAAQLLNIMAIHPEWQERVLADLRNAVDMSSSLKHGTLVEKLNRMPLEAWDTCSSNLDLCLKEVLRMWMTISASRRNIGTEPIVIPGTNEVVPPGTFAIHNTTETHFNEKLYPDPTKFDPMRYTEGREEFKQEQYSYLSWGQGQKPCPGQRWAKMQMAIVVAYALAQYKWSACSEDGTPDPTAKHRKMLDSANQFSLPPTWCKIEPREVE